MEQGHSTISDEGISRLSAALAAETVKVHYRIGDNAWNLQQEVLKVLRRLQPAELGVGSDRTTDDVPEAVVVGMRTQARLFAATYLRWSTATLAESGAEMANIVGNPALSAGHWAKVLGGRDGDPSLAQLQRAAAHLRDGAELAEAAQAAEVSMRQVKALSTFMGVIEWRRAQLVDAATMAVEEGLTVDAFTLSWNSHHSHREHISRSAAGRAMAEGRRILKPVAA